MKNYILWTLPFILISAIIGFIHFPNSLIDSYFTIIATNITIAIFSITFSFFQYQYNLYKSLIKNISVLHISLSVLTLILSLIPLVVLNYSAFTISKLALISTPIIVYMGILNSIIVMQAIKSSTIINNYSSYKSVSNYLNDFTPVIISYLNELKELRLADHKDEPQHEWSSKTSPNSIGNDPFEALLSIGIESIKFTDIATFEQTLNAIYKISEIVLEHKINSKSPKGYEIKSVLENHCFSIIESLAKATVKYDSTYIFCRKYMNISDNFLRKLANKYLHTSALFSEIIFSMRDLSYKLLEFNESDLALITIIISRQAAEKAIKCKKEPDIVFKANSTYLVHSVIKEIGTKAINLKDSDFLYRCIDALGWLGCSAVKNDEFEIGRACLKELVQLGREARASKLECFWDSCALLPVDHAEERIGWMLTLVGSRKEKDRVYWLESFETAYSRLSGYETKIEFELKDGKPFFKFINSKKKYLFSYSTNSSHRTIDYSDFDMLKNMKLY